MYIPRGRLSSVKSTGVSACRVAVVVRMPSTAYMWSVAGVCGDVARRVL